MYYPTWFLFIDYILGAFMWLFILKFMLSLFFSVDTKLRLIKSIYKIVNKILILFYKITPRFLPEPVVALYFGWIFFLFRFYILPLFSGIGDIGYLSFSIENNLHQYIEYYVLNRI